MTTARLTKAYEIGEFLLNDQPGAIRLSTSPSCCNFGFTVNNHGRFELATLLSIVTLCDAITCWANTAGVSAIRVAPSLIGSGIACVDHFSWDAYHEGRDLPEQVEAYKNRHGHYPEKLLADPAYGTRENRKFLKEKGIRFAGKPLGRPPKIASADKDAERRQKQQDYRERIPIEGKFGQGKNGYQLNTIRARTAQTSEAWVRSIFLVMNLLVLFRIFCAHMPKRVRPYLMRILTDKIKRMIDTIDAAVPKLNDQTFVTVTF